MGLTLLQDIVANGGSELLSSYHDSPSLLLSSTFPEYNWLPWKFQGISNRFWHDKENQLNYMNWLATHLGLQSMEGWYNVSAKVFQISITDKF